MPLSEEFKQLSKEIKEEQIIKDLERKHGIHLLDFSILILTILLAIDIAALLVKLIV